MKRKSAWLLVVLFPVVVYGTFQLAYWNRSYPGISSFGLYLGNKDHQQIESALNQNFPTQRTLTLAWGTSHWEINSDQIKLQYDAKRTADTIFAVGRRSSLWQNFFDQVRSFRKGLDVPPYFSLEENLLAEQVSRIATEIDVPAREPEVVWENNQIVVHTGDNGQRVDDRQLRERIRQSLFQASNSVVDIPVVPISPKISVDQAKVLEQRAQKLVGKKLAVKFEGQTWEIGFGQAINWLDAQAPGWKTTAIESWIVGLADNINRPAENALFDYQDNRVVEFKPAITGIEVDQNQLLIDIQSSLSKLESSDQEEIVNVTYASTAPSVKTADVNNLGIKEVIGRGESDYSGSIPNRVFNLTKAAKAMHGVLIAPGETFSFNKYVGDISLESGYKQAYIIKEGKTILGDGGGVCQVSTTMFRAALNSGLPIEERTAHAYRVHYYENDSPPGVDATIFTPTTDFKFRNDTPGHILIQMRHDPVKRKLVFELYGTADGRSVEISKPKIWDITPPPPDVYQDDPTLARGVVKQVDWKAPGAKASFTYKVTRNGEMLQDRTFYSNYRPWQAVYLRGTL